MCSRLNTQFITDKNINFIFYYYKNKVFENERSFKPNVSVLISLKIVSHIYYLNTKCILVSNLTNLLGSPFTILAAALEILLLCKPSHTLPIWNLMLD